MAYAATITVTEANSGPFRGYVLTIAETDVASTSEATIALATEGLPTVGRIWAQIASLDSGTGTTIDPILGDVTDPATGAWKVENDTAAALIHNQAATAIRYSATTLYHRSVPDAGTDNVVTTRYYICAGWD